MDYNLSNLSCKRLEESYLPVARPKKAKSIRERSRKAVISMVKSDQREYHAVILRILLHDEGKFYHRLNLDLRLKMNIGYNTPTLLRTPNALSVS